MKIEDVICDQCGARKGKDNNWYGVTIKSGFLLFKSGTGMDNIGGVKDICSMNCAMKALQEFLDPPVNGADYVEEIMQDLESRIPK